MLIFQDICLLVEVVQQYANGRNVWALSDCFLKRESRPISLFRHFIFHGTYTSIEEKYSKNNNAIHVEIIMHWMRSGHFVSLFHLLK